MKLVLWDIDGTLVSFGGIAGEAMRAAVLATYGMTPTSERRSYAGKTDLRIIAETLPDLAPDAIRAGLPAFETAYIELLATMASAQRDRIRALPGAQAAIARLAREDVHQAPLTGNVAGAARVKLDLTGLSEHMDFDSGAYGGDDPAREALPAYALARASARTGRTFAASDIVIIGDTAHDISCARAVGARVVAVATGPYTAAELASYGADAVLADLTDAEALVAAVMWAG